jgi:hypothetical protein
LGTALDPLPVSVQLKFQGKIMIAPKQVAGLCAMLATLSIALPASAGVFDGYPSRAQFDPAYPHPHQMALIEKMKPEGQKMAMEMLAKMEQLSDMHQMEMMQMEMKYQKEMMELKGKFTAFTYTFGR